MMEASAAGLPREEHADEGKGNLGLLNGVPAADFVIMLGGVFERSPWVAERVHGERPFADLDRLHAAMVRAVEGATRAQKLALLRAHPELGGREARTGLLTRSSEAEQSSASLDELSPIDLARMNRLNAEYRAKFRFPFIIAVRKHTKEAIFSELERRLVNDADTEIRACLNQVYDIARIRLEALLATGCAMRDR